MAKGSGSAVSATAVGGVLWVTDKAAVVAEICTVGDAAGVGEAIKMSAAVGDAGTAVAVWVGRAVDAAGLVGVAVGVEVAQALSQHPITTRMNKYFARLALNTIAPLCSKIQDSRNRWMALFFLP
jgi:hypothetical protein